MTNPLPWLSDGCCSCGCCVVQTVGGLCWCISNAGSGVEANILFNEDQPLGKKM